MSMSAINETIHVSAQTIGFTNNTVGNDYNSRVEIFKRKFDKCRAAHIFCATLLNFC